MLCLHLFSFTTPLSLSQAAWAIYDPHGVGWVDKRGFAQQYLAQQAASGNMLGYSPDELKNALMPSGTPPHPIISLPHRPLQARKARGG